MKYDQEWATKKIAIQKEEPTLEELVRRMEEINIKFQEWADEKIQETDVVARREKTDQMIGEIADYVHEMKSPHDPDIVEDGCCPFKIVFDEDFYVYFIRILLCFKCVLGSA